jgi:hypothetical protein
MHSLSKTLIATSCLIVAMTLLAPTFGRADEWNLTTRFTVNHPFEVPGKVLQPNTPYVIRLMDSPSNRTIVQIFNEGQTDLLTTFMAIPAIRPEPTDHTMFRFIETEAGFPLPIKEWFYPGRVSGLEFIYPKDQAKEIALHAQERVLTAEGGHLRRLGTVDIEAGKVGKVVGVTETAANVTSTESTAVPEETAAVTPVPPPDNPQIAQQENPPEISEPALQQESPETAPAPAANTAEAPATAKATEPELPRTAGELPLIALIGVICLGTGLRWRNLSSNKG